MSTVAGINFELVNSSVYEAVKTRETLLRNRIVEIGSEENPGTLDLLLLQQEIQQWSMMIQIQSTVVKELSDTMKGIIQKSA